MQYQKPKGTRDFYPAEMDSRKQVFSTLRSVAERYGFSEIESPAFEYTKLLTDKSGEEIKQQLFNLEKKGDEEFSLRPELTPAVTRMFIAKQKELQKPVRWYYLTRMWRYERPQAGRLREFYQFGVELFGSDKTQADAEIISLAIDALLALGLTKKDFVIKINSRELLNTILNKLKITNKEEVLRVIDKFRKISDEEFTQELKKLNLTLVQITNIKKEIKSKDYSKNSQLTELFRLLKSYGKEDYVEFDLSIARGLAYYTGIVFECYDREESMRAIFGGGRYDNLIQLFGGAKEPATGFALGDVTLQLLLEKKGLWPKKRQNVDFYIAIVDDKSRDKAIGVAAKLRKKYNVDIDIVERKLGRQIDYANYVNAGKVIVIGEDEIKSGKLTVKDLKTGKEEKIVLDKL